MKRLLGVALFALNIRCGSGTLIAEFEQSFLGVRYEQDDRSAWKPEYLRKDTRGISLDVEDPDCRPLVDDVSAYAESTPLEIRYLASWVNEPWGSRRCGSNSLGTTGEFPEATLDSIEVSDSSGSLRIEFDDMIPRRTFTPLSPAARGERLTLEWSAPEEKLALIDVQLHRKVPIEGEQNLWLPEVELEDNRVTVVLPAELEGEAYFSLNSIVVVPIRTCTATLCDATLRSTTEVPLVIE